MPKPRPYKRFPDPTTMYPDPTSMYPDPTQVKPETILESLPPGKSASLETEELDYTPATVRPVRKTDPVSISPVSDEPPSWGQMAQYNVGRAGEVYGEVPGKMSETAKDLRRKLQKLLGIQGGNPPPPYAVPHPYAKPHQVGIGEAVIEKPSVEIGEAVMEPRGTWARDALSKVYCGKESCSFPAKSSANVAPPPDGPDQWTPAKKAWMAKQGKK